MSNCKDGEGVVRFNPLHFTSPNLAVERTCDVLVIADNNVILSERNHLDTPPLGQDVSILPHARAGQFQLTIPNGIFLTYYPQTFDIIIRVNNVTVQFFANVERIEQDN